MQYALLAYSPPEETDRAARPIPDALADMLARPAVTGWARLHADGSATTLRNGESGMLLTDGPFIDSKEYLAGLILIEADNLDAALATAAEMLQTTRPGTAIEVRPGCPAIVSSVEGRLPRREPDGGLVTHADLGRPGWNDVVADDRGNVYVNRAGFDPMAAVTPGSGREILRPLRT